MTFTIQRFPTILDPTAHTAAVELLHEAQRADGVEPLGEAFLRGLTEPDIGHSHITVSDSDSGTCIAIAGIAKDSVELVVHPAFRRRGIGKHLLSEVDNAVAKQTKLPVWAHGNLPGAAQLATSSGRGVVRELLQMEISGDALNAAADVDRSARPDGIRAVSYVELAGKKGADEVDRGWLDVNNEAFDWHPEQGGWSLRQLDIARHATWFDPAGVWFAVDGADKIVGFHWVKMHDEQGKLSVGEVYVIGIANSARGRGIGGWLTRVGLQHVVKKGAASAILYVEGDNIPAVRTYENIGFRTSRADIMYG